MFSIMAGRIRRRTMITVSSEKLAGKLNEAQALLDVMAERLKFTIGFLTRLQEDVEGQLSLNEDLLDEHERLTEKWKEDED
jgi:hypothetical protein